MAHYKLVRSDMKELMNVKANVGYLLKDGNERKIEKKQERV